MHLSRHRLVGILLLLLASQACNAQFQLPRFDVELKGGIALLSADQTIDQSYYVKDGRTFNFHAGAHWQLNQNIGIGWVYSKSLSGALSFDTSNGSQPPPDDNIYLLMNGPDIRISTGRTKKWRPYLSLNYFAIEFVEQKNGYRLAAKTNSFGGGMGIMYRISNKIYWNVIDLQMHPISKDAIYWLTKSEFFAEAKTGLTINFGKRK